MKLALPNTPVFKILCAVGKRVGVFYLFVLILFLLIADYESIKGAKLVALNRLRPDAFDYLLTVSDGAEEANRDKVRRYLTYYKKLSRNMPGRGDVKGLMGFCYYHSGEKAKALEAYREASEKDPRFFWFHYNVGAIHFENGEYQKAIEALNKAVAIEVVDAVIYIRSSKVYQSVLKMSDVEEAAMSKKIKADLLLHYRKAYQMLVISSYKLQNYNNTIRYASYATRNMDAQDFFYYYLGLTAYTLQDYGVAVNFFNMCLKKNPDYGEAYYYLGGSLKALGKGSAAQGALQKAKYLGGGKKSDERIAEEVWPRIF